MSTYRIEDTIADNPALTGIAPEDVPSAIASWFPSVSDDIQRSVDRLGVNLMTGKRVDDLALYLGIIIRRE